MDTWLAVPSLSSAGLTWRVRRMKDVWECECPRYDFSKAPKRCRHTDLIVRAEGMLRQCAAVHGGTDGRLCRQCLVTLLALSMRRHHGLVAEAKREGRVEGRQAARRRRKKR